MSDIALHSLLIDPSKYGVPEKMLIHLSDREPTYAHLPYLDLFHTESTTVPDAVLEVNGRAALYLISDSLNNQQIAELTEMLASRADARYFGILRPGSLDIFPIGLFSQNEEQPCIRTIELQIGNPALHDFLIKNNPNENGYSKTKRSKLAEAAWLDNYLFKLLQVMAKNLRELVSPDKLGDDQILSLVGRGLFTRFIIDRKIICAADVTGIDASTDNLKDLFKDPKSTTNTFSWLDRTFNGNLLPLVGIRESRPRSYKDFFDELGDDVAQKICAELQDILHATLNRQYSLEWERIRFQHVPADMLSQVYEHFAHAYQKEYAKVTSIHYTPRHIAKTLVDSAFDGLQMSDKSYAHVLDPAAGAGVFLVLAFKQLVLERWKNSRERPSRFDIREILNNQLCGLDINTESLKFAALSLYLTALELDPSPTPLSELRFDCLIGNALMNVAQGEDPSQALGSLSESLTTTLVGRFDIVVGNPPWTKKDIASGAQFNTLVRRIAHEKGVAPDLAEKLDVDRVPDIPFVWRALEWAKPNGMIAYALHAQHTLFNHGKSMEMRSALFDCLELTGIMNCSALRQESAIWANNDAPFCFLLARNKTPDAFSSFYYISPTVEKTLNKQGMFRIDPQMAIPVEQRHAQTSPYLFKTLFRGTWLDYEIIERIRTNPHSGEGFQLGNGKVSAEQFFGQYILETSDKDNHRYQIDTSQLRLFSHEKIYSKKPSDLFKQPMVLFPESPPFERERRGGLLSQSDLIYSESFVGFSCANHPNGMLLAKYIQLLSYSDLFLYFLLMTSSKFGVERESFLTKEIYSFPMVDFNHLTAEHHAEIIAINKLMIQGKQPWHEIDTFIASLYGLTPIDRQVIKDSLATALPYDIPTKFSQSAPMPETIESFLEEMIRILRPFTQRLELDLWAKPDLSMKSREWRFFRIGFSNTIESRTTLDELFLTKLADHFWVSRLQVNVDEHGFELLVGQLAQNRYWTKTRARILALDYLHNKLDELKSKKESI
jgi:hypothetical protein